ncbi:uncharacterized protein [Spinacia oleracea]|uniref:Uncharacterized protein isoform X3 n=1 Tax=Spinacia oleracea TaxID=3562 RepID=A0ABM3RC68_SPIOL|nr:uncharacterized protein LOC110798931 isoform X3 [Spinacia oleracea]
MQQVFKLCRQSSIPSPPFSQPAKLAFTIFHAAKALAVATSEAANNGDSTSSSANDAVSWISLDVSKKHSRSLSNVGFSKPSLTQAAYVPLILSENDAVVAAETGSGKPHHARINSGFGAHVHLSQKWSINQLVVKSISLSSSTSVFLCLGVVQWYSSKSNSSGKQKLKPKAVMEEEKGAYFVVRKGDIVGVYKSLSECQAQVGSSVSDLSATVYKGNSLPKDAEEYLASRGLHNALYTIKASDLKDCPFGKIVPCPFEKTCILHFDGSSKGNPIRAGAGAVLRTLNGNLICRIRQGLGNATSSVAEYRAFILGLKKALEMGCTRIQAQGDNKIVCMQELNSDADKQAKLAAQLADGQVQEVLT